MSSMWYYIFPPLPPPLPSTTIHRASSIILPPTPFLLSSNPKLIVPIFLSLCLSLSVSLSTLMLYSRVNVWCKECRHVELYKGLGTREFPEFSFYNIIVCVVFPYSLETRNGWKYISLEYLGIISGLNHSFAMCMYMKHYNGNTSKHMPKNRICGPVIVLLMNPHAEKHSYAHKTIPCVHMHETLLPRYK